MDVDTFEATYIPEYEDEDEEKGGRDFKGGRGGRGGRGGNRGSRGGRGGRDYDNFDAPRGQGRGGRGRRGGEGYTRGGRNHEDDDGGIWENEQGETVPVEKAPKRKQFKEIINKEGEWPEI